MEGKSGRKTVPCVIVEFLLWPHMDVVGKEGHGEENIASCYFNYGKVFFGKLCHKHERPRQTTNINHSSIDFPINFNSLLSADVYFVRADGVGDF